MARALTRILLFLACWELSASAGAWSQNSLQHVLPQQASADSTMMSEQAVPAEAETGNATRNLESASKLSIKEWLSIIQIDPITALVALASLVFIVYFARKRRLAELRAEHEFKRRTQVEERLRKVEDHIALREADRRFEEDEERRKTSQLAKTAEERYRYILETEVCRIHLTAPGIEEVPVSLDEAFVHLNISEHYRGEEFPTLGEAGRAHGEREDLTPEEVMVRAFQEFDRKLLLIIGDPGSGKTTLLKYYARCCLEPEEPREPEAPKKQQKSKKRKPGYRRLGFAGPVFPFYLPLREVDPIQSLAANLSRWANERLEAPIAPEEFQQWLERRDTLVLLDGLDEISQLEDRKAVCRWIDNKSAGLKHGRLVVTSRGTGLRGQNLVLNTPHLHAEVRDFSHQQKQEFLRKWFRAAHLESSRPLEHESEAEWRLRQLREADKHAQEVIAYLDQQDNRSLRELAGIPMLLQLIALIWKKYQTRPESRTKLYDIALDYLLEYRDDQRGLKPLLNADGARRVLLPVSLWMQEKLNADEVEKDRLHAYIKPILEPIASSVTAEDLCTNLRDRAAVIADYGKNEYIFRHKSFREYFAGLQLVSDYVDNQRLNGLVETFGESWWAEALRYFLSKADGKAFTAFMRAFFDSDKSRELSQEQQDLLQALLREAPERPLDALLACLNDNSKTATQQRYALDCLKTIGGDRVREALEAFVGAGVGQASVLEYAREVAAQLAAPTVRAVHEVSRLNLFVELPASFRNPLEYNAEYILIRAGTVHSSATKKVEEVPDLYFAKYPVTNKQYRRFIHYLQGEERGLDWILSLHTFAETLVQFATSDGAYLDYLGSEAKGWPAKLRSSYDEDRKFNGEDQPVVGVNWYAARAYCLWLSLLEIHQSGRSSVPATVYRLPHEIEWERAAAGRQEDGPPREYPWPSEKGEPNDKLANFGSNVGQTTPVGRYPEGATPEGLMDMAGNVWEWQENLYGDKDHSAARAVRGGPWYVIHYDLRCRVRSGVIPDGRYNDLGFRVVRSES